MDSRRGNYRVFSTFRFRNAAVSKYWASSVLVTSCAVLPFTHLHHRLPYPFAWNTAQVCNFFASQFFFTHVHSIVLGVLHIYQCRHVERFYGSRKFLNFLLLSFFGVKFLEMTGLLLLKYCQFDVPYLFVPGPYGMLAACLVQYLCDTPYIPMSRVFGVLPISVKLIPLLLSFQLNFWSFPTLLSFASGCVFGALYRAVPLLQRINWFPSVVANQMRRLLRPLSDVFEDKCGTNLPIAATKEAQRQQLIDTVERSLMSMQMRQVYQQQQQDQVPNDNRLPFLDRVFNRNNIVVDESNMDTLVDMGFTDRETVRQALIDCRNDVNDAAQLLLSQHN